MSDETTAVAPATPDAPAAPSTETSQATPAEGQAPSPESYFLTVNDRTKYKTQEDAVKAYGEASSRIASLSRYEEAAKQYGIIDPSAIPQLFDELLRFRESQQSATPAAGRSDAATVQAAAKGSQVAYDQLTPEWKQWVDNLSAVGFVRKDDISKLESRLDSLSSQQESNYNAQVEAAKTTGVSLLTSMLKENGLPHDEATIDRISNQIGDAVYGESHDKAGKLIFGSPEYRFIYGSDADRKTILDKHLEFYKGLSESYHTAKSASYAQQKTAAAQTATSRLPQSNAPAPADPSKMTQLERERARRARLDAILAGE